MIGRHAFDCVQRPTAAFVLDETTPTSLPSFKLEDDEHPCVFDESGAEYGWPYCWPESCSTTVTSSHRSGPVRCRNAERFGSLKSARRGRKKWTDADR